MTRSDGFIRLLKAEHMDMLDWPSLRLWAHYAARYHFPTRETIQALKAYIAANAPGSAIEIGSGAGDLAHYLGIPATDSRIQEDPGVALMYKAMKQPTIQYPPFVQKFEALAAIKHFKPKVVIGAWITHWIDPDLPVPEGGGSVYGVKEDLIVKSGVTYVMIGHRETHRYKPILKLPHDEIGLPSLRSRAGADGNCIFIWNHKGPRWWK